MKKFIYFIMILVCGKMVGQQIYCNFEDAKVVIFKTWTGQLDTLYQNPDTTGIDTSEVCARYVRKPEMYDNIKMVPYHKLLDVSSYASSSTHAPRIKMKILTSMPPGTQVKIQLGAKDDENYPSGVHSEYIAYTSIQNEWEELVFNFSLIPAGSMVAAEDVDKITIMFNPGSANSDVIYFDDVKGPQLMAIGIEKRQAVNFKLQQNNPNPASGQTRIKFSLQSAGPVLVKLYDVLGNEVMTLLEKNLVPGDYSIPVETVMLPDGIYFYTLKKEGTSQSIKMIVSK